MAKTQDKRAGKQQKVKGPILVVGTLLALVLVGLAAFTLVRVIGANDTTSYANVSVQDLANANAPRRVVLDVRELWEYEQGRVPGATLIPLGELGARASELPDNVPIYVICRSGNRSVAASKILLKAGKQDVRNVQGGILAWQQAGLPVER